MHRYAFLPFEFFYVKVNLYTKKMANVGSFINCKIGGVVPAVGHIRLDFGNYISKNIIDKTARIINNENNIMHPSFENDPRWFTPINSNEIGQVMGLRFTVKNSHDKDEIIGHKDNWFTVISDPDILILGTPWLWLFEISINIFHGYITVYGYMDDKIKIYSTKNEALKVSEFSIAYAGYTDSNSDSESVFNSGIDSESD